MKKRESKENVQKDKPDKEVAIEITQQGPIDAIEESFLPDAEIDNSPVIKLESISLQVFRVKEILDEKTYLKFGTWMKEADEAKVKRFDLFETMRKKSYAAYKDVKANQNKAVKPFEELIMQIKDKRSKYYVKVELERKEREDSARRKREEEERQAARVAQEARQRVEAQEQQAKSKAAKEKAAEARVRLEAETAKQDLILAELPVMEQNPLADNRDGYTKIKDFDILVVDEMELLKTIVKGKIPALCIEVKLNKLKSWVNATGVDLEKFPFMKKIPKVIERKKSGGW